MIDCAGLVLSLGSARTNGFLQKAEVSYIGLTPKSAGLNAVPGPMPNSSIAYLTGTMHDGKHPRKRKRRWTQSAEVQGAGFTVLPASDGGETDEPRRRDI
jgi:hypothetical protein